LRLRRRKVCKEVGRFTQRPRPDTQAQRQSMPPNPPFASRCGACERSRGSK
jgi:hypothetical protein